MIIIDTHVLIWMTQQPDLLHLRAVKAIESHWQSGQLYVSAISFWECQMLHNKGRIELQENVTDWRDKLLLKGLKELSIDGDVAVLSANLNLHGDPADRFIVATAMLNNATLITADKKILAYQGDLETIAAK